MIVAIAILIFLSLYTDLLLFYFPCNRFFFSGFHIPIRGMSLFQLCCLLQCFCSNSNIITTTWSCKCRSEIMYTVFALFCLHLTCLKAKFREKNYIYSCKFFHNFHLFESSFTSPRLWASGLVRRLCICQYYLCHLTII